METVLLHAENPHSLGILDIQGYKHVKIGPVTEIEVFESARALVKDVQVPSRHPGHVKFWVLTLATKVLKPCLDLSLRAQGDREHRHKVNSHW